jgi:hypothetical protein
MEVSDAIIFRAEFPVTPKDLPKNSNGDLELKKPI